MQDKIPQNWKNKDNVELYRVFKFENFIEAMEFINKVAEIAERLQHHPDIYISYNKVAMRLSTHSEGTLTEKDFKLAEAINNEAS